jgi:chromate transporter
LPAPLQTNRLASLAALSLRIGNLTFGGGEPAMAALQREFVEKRAWLSQDDFTLIWSLARVTPGTNVQACFAGAGWRLAGWTGALMATVASCLPAAVLCYWLAAAERQWQSNAWVAAGLRGVGATVAGTMVAGAILLLKPAWRENRLAPALAFALAAAVASHLGAPPIAALGCAAVAGWCWSAKEPSR